MPIRGDRLRWPPRPGKKFSEPAGTRRTLTTDEQNSNEPLQQPDERDQTADRDTRPRRIINRAHDDLTEGQQDTDLRNRSRDIIRNAPKTDTPRRK